jgi:hypothetical protein
MKYPLFLGIIFLITGCSTPTIITSDIHNAIIPLGGEEVGIFIPESWEKVPQTTGGENIILMARNGDENIVISFEQSTELVTGNSLCDGVAKGFSPFQQTFVDENNCFFSGHPAPNTPLRNFLQKIVRTPDTTNFLLASCSSEQQSNTNTTCPAILDSFKILEKTN